MLRSHAALLAVSCLGALSACRPSPPAPSSTGQTAPDSARAGLAPAPTPDAAPRPAREDLIRAALERVPAIREKVSKLRDLPSRPVPAEYQSQEDFKRYLRRELALELPPEKSAPLSRALRHLGLLTKDLDLFSTLEHALLSQAGAYYDPTSRKFFVVMVPENAMMLDVLSAHELTHAVQDQHFDLIRYLGGRGNTQKLSEDALHARRFVVEGEATLVMLAYALEGAMHADPFAPDQLPALRMQVNMMAGMDAEKLAQLTASQADAFVGLGEDFKRAMEAVPSIPPYVLVPLYEAYFKGARTVLEAYAAGGGWAGVARLYADPPDSTEQVLHPTEKLLGRRDEPTPVKLPVPAALRGWTLLHTEVMGELLWRVWFRNWKAADPDRVAAGWDGDRWAVYEQGDRRVALIKTVWDTPEDAREFADAYQAAAAPRNAKVAVAIDGVRVNAVDGCEGELCTQLLAALR